MKIAVYGATGRVGTQVVLEAIDRGHDVTALSRRPAVTADEATWQQGNAADADSVAKVAAEHDVVVSAIGPSHAPGADRGDVLVAIDTLAQSVGRIRLVVVGGAGSLLAAPGVRLVDTPEFPAAYLPDALIQVAALDRLRQAPTDLDWTYLSPAPEVVDGPRTGTYRTGLDEPAGSSVSVADLAVALLDEIEQPRHPRQRFTVAN
jgi:putative NADH-flavin reductase